MNMIDIDFSAHRSWDAIELVYVSLTLFCNSFDCVVDHSYDV